MNYSIPARQNGSALVVVVLFLVLIMLGGVVAVRQARLDMRVATADQVGTVLLQSADDGQKHLENAINADLGKPAQKTIYDNLINNVYGGIGYFMHAKKLEPNSTKLQNTYFYCYTPNSNFSRQQATIKTPSGGVVNGGNGGICGANSYTSSRQIARVQMAISALPSDISAEALAHYDIGSDLEDGFSQKIRVDATATVPAYHPTSAPATTVTQVAEIKRDTNCSELTAGGERECAIKGDANP